MDCSVQKRNITLINNEYTAVKKERNVLINKQNNKKSPRKSVIMCNSGAHKENMI